MVESTLVDAPASIVFHVLAVTSKRMLVVLRILGRTRSTRLRSGMRAAVERWTEAMIARRLYRRELRNLHAYLQGDAPESRAARIGTRNATAFEAPRPRAAGLPADRATRPSS